MKPTSVQTHFSSVLLSPRTSKDTISRHWGPLLMEIAAATLLCVKWLTKVYPICLMKGLSSRTKGLSNQPPSETRDNTSVLQQYVVIEIYMWCCMLLININ